MIVFTALAINIFRMVKELYFGRDIEGSKIEYYIDIADEIGEKKVQLNWKELLAIESVQNDGDLQNIKKNDSLKIANKFVEKKENSEGKTVYTKKDLDTVLNELAFQSSQKIKVKSMVSSLEDVFLGSERISKNDYRIEFIDKMKDPSIENYKQYKVLPSITIAQAILESGWGGSKLTKQCNNLFGIKADKRWSGESKSFSTGENYNDVIVASFRVYPSFEESIIDHGKFLNENARYKNNNLFAKDFYKSQAQALENAGYSTKKNSDGEAVYADMLIEIIQKYNLQIIDSEVIGK